MYSIEADMDIGLFGQIYLINLVYYPEEYFLEGENPSVMQFCRNCDDFLEVEDYFMISGQLK